MRIVGGMHRSRKLETPHGDAVRPTSDKVRQAVFNMLNSRGLVQDAHVIDAFCGTGALGLEALSQGAAHCTFFDSSKNSIQLCKANVQSLKEGDRADVVFQDVTKVKEKPENTLKADLIFLDPPYNKNLVPLTIKSLIDQNWISEGAFFIIETEKNEIIISERIHKENEKIYGDTKIILASLKS